MSLFIKNFIYYFIILVIILVIIKIFIITLLIVKGDWIASPSFLWSIVEWNKEALKILGMAILAAIAALYSCIHT